MFDSILERLGKIIVKYDFLILYGTIGATTFALLTFIFKSLADGVLS